ncbi:helix-turn-helix domain-containing protein [Chloroflexota bacterium]
MIPNNPNDWDFQLVEKLVRDGFFETDKFDFKEDLPYKNDRNGNERLEKSVCAFANTEGGFLIFGIKDDRSLPYKDRIIGIDPKKDFPKEFGDKLSNIEPHLYYEFRNPAISMPGSNNIIHIVKIPQSPESPHWTSKKGFEFRTNKGNEVMNYQQVKQSFLNEEQKRQKLRLLLIELTSNRQLCDGMIMAEDKIEGYHSLVTLDSNVLQTLLVDAYSIIINDDELVSILFRLKGTIRLMNNEMQIFISKVSLPSTGMKKTVRDHNEFVKGQVENIIPLFDRALEILVEKYGFSNLLE